MGAEIGVVLLVLVWFVLVFGGFGVWIWALVDVARTPEHAFRMIGREKSNWILLVALAQFIGALIWAFSPTRKDVKAAFAASSVAPGLYGPPAGWYPDSAGGPGLLWWDGQRWTGHRQSGPPDVSPPTT